MRSHSSSAAAKHKPGRVSRRFEASADAASPTRTRLGVPASACFAALVLTACADEPALPQPLISFACPGGTITEGMNELPVYGAPRSFYAEFPADPSQSLGVIFSWHGYGDTLEHHRSILGLDPTANPQLPVVVITPDDAGAFPPDGLDWDIGRGNADDPNVDIEFFGVILGCLNQQRDIDPTRIYSIGFSAGAVMTSLLYSRYPTLLSAIVVESGAWFNDAAEADLVSVFDVEWSWPSLRRQDQGTVLLTHGGPTDITVYGVLDLEASAQAAFPFLRRANRTVVDCPHTAGHALHPEMTPAMISDFFSAHRGGQSSAYRTQADITDVFPTGCTLRTP